SDGPDSPAESRIDVRALGRFAVQRSCSRCEQEDLVVQSKVASPGMANRARMQAPGGAADLVRGHGAQLQKSARAFFETQFQRDFSQVRIHTDGGASRSARALNALAYTVGHDIVFASGQYRPETRQGRRLLAHELTHVVQQENGLGPTDVQRFSGPTPPVSVTPEGIAQMRQLAVAVRALLVEGSVTAAESAELATLVAEAETAIATATEIAAAGATATAVGQGALAASAGLAADDVTGVGVADDVAIPFVLLGAAVAFGIGFAIGYNADEIAEAWSRAANAVSRAIKKMQEVANRPHPQADAQSQPQTAPKPQAVPKTSTKTQSERNRCQDLHPYANVCDYVLADREEVVIAKLMEEGYSYSDLGECKGVGSFAPGAINACDGAPGERWHCTVKGSNQVISVFGCLCCDEDGSTGTNWRGAHISTNLSKRGK
ncbi:MAG TPA: DUF4157 domain-containing protein, partial [Polyangiaceae bacterium]